MAGRSAARAGRQSQSESATGEIPGATATTTGPSSTVRNAGGWSSR
nr:MAG TPA: hypothetical protein [Caudoviricetes sp.]